MKRLIVLFLLLLSPTAFPQETKFQEAVQVNLVDLYLTATDNKGHFIKDLNPNEITVLEDGVPQEVQRFGAFAGQRNEIPILMALVIDNSASMDDKIEDEKKLDVARDAGLDLLEELGPLDRAMLSQFSDTVKSTALTTDKNAIGDALKNMKPRWWQTALFDALHTSIEELNKTSGRKILLLCSDGMDNMSSIKMDKIFDTAAHTPELTMIVIGTVSDRQPMGLHGKVQSMPSLPEFHGKEILQQLADRTAGYAYFPKNAKDAAKVRELLKTFVQSQYYLAYRPTNEKMDGSWRRIELRCKRKDVKLHYRTGYFAAS
jgi:VWFA-related protein